MNEDKYTYEYAVYLKSGHKIWMCWTNITKEDSNKIIQDAMCERTTVLDDGGRIIKASEIAAICIITKEKL